MNRYERAGVLDDIRAGRRVVLVDVRRSQAALNFLQVVAEADPQEWEYVRRTNGNERAAHVSGGELIPMAINHQGLRGLVCDVVAAENYRDMAFDQAQTVREFAAHAGNARPVPVEIIPCSG